ncbi:WD40 repeat domain-containing protein [Pelagicoccus enzymogenes]|uniref:WD40 repeat domain-containing protein n=1 Tax=Pelagicoccus enzymogenes TaxID=2773457 RepID=UPI00280D66B0|nr:WD40 repeat domain-containing protein [Pelagicoccus enzymogenes]MDQ8198927.1 WD40 repeat domain-containing protein [Pelagicoccus enzymogenes]
MKLGLQLLLICAFGVLGAHAKGYLNFFGDGERLSTGMLLAAPPELSSPGEILTVNGSQTLYWNETTGELLREETTDQPVPKQTDPLVVDSPAANLLAYIDSNHELILIQRESGNLIGIHNFDTEYNKREIIEIKLLPQARLLSVYTEPQQPACYSRYCAQSFSSHYDLVDTQTGEIVRSFTPGGRTIYKYLSPPGSELILIISSADPFQGYVPNPNQEFSPDFALASEIQFIDPLTGAELLPSLGSADPRYFTGAFSFDASGENLFAIMEADSLKKIHLPTHTISEVEIPEHQGARNMRLSGDTLFAMLLDLGNFSPAYRLATWDAETLKANPAIGSDSGMSSYLPIDGGSRAIVIDRDRNIELWDLSQGSKTRTIKTLPLGQSLLQWSASPDSHKLYAHVHEQATFGPAVDTEYIWSTLDGSTLLERERPPENAPPPIAQFTSNSQKILLYSATGEVSAVQLSSGETAFSLPLSKTIATGYYANGKKALAVHANGRLKRFSENDTVTEFQLPYAPLTPYHIDPQTGRFLFGASEAIHTYDPDTNQIENIWSIADGELPDRALVNSDSTRLQLFWQVYDNSDVETPSRSLVIDLENETILADIKTAPVSALTYSADSQQFAFRAGGEFTLRIHSLDTGELVSSMAWIEPVEGIAFSVDKQDLFIISGAKLQRVEIATETSLAAIPFPASQRANPVDYYRTHVSADGRLLAIAGFSGELHLFNLPSLAPIDTPATGLAHSLYNHGFNVSLAPDASSFMSIDFLGTTRRWKLQEGHPIDPEPLLPRSGGFQLSLIAAPQMHYQILRSEDLKSWHKGPPVPQLGSTFPVYLSGTETSQFFKVIEYPHASTP